MERRPSALPSIHNNVELTFRSYSLEAPSSTSMWLLPGPKPISMPAPSAPAPLLPRPPSPADKTLAVAPAIKKTYQRQRSQLIFTELYIDGKAPIKRKRMRRGQAKPTASAATTTPDAGAASNKMAIDFLCSSPSQAAKKSAKEH